MENKLYSLDINDAEWNGNSISFKLDNLDINDSMSNHNYKCSSNLNPNGIFLTKTNEEEYHVKNTSIHNGKISLQLEQVSSEKCLSPNKKNTIKLFIKHT